MGAVSLSQSTYMGRLKYSDHRQVIRGGVLHAEKNQLMTFYKKHLGSLLRTLQCRMGVSLRIIPIGTLVIPATSEVKDILSRIKEINKAPKLSGGRSVSLTYIRVLPRMGRSESDDSIRTRVFVFSDAGISPPPVQKSVECAAILTGRELGRDGSILRAGCVVDCFVRKMSQAARSTVSSESTASRNAIEIGLWRQSNLVAWIAGETIDYRIRNRGPTTL